MGVQKRTIDKRRTSDTQDVLVLPLLQDVTVLGSDRNSAFSALRRTGCTRFDVVIDVTVLAE